jgi:hypothetical protein
MSFAVQQFIPGDGTRTAWSAAAMNELVGAINSLLMLQTGKGLKFHSTPANCTLSLDEEYIEKLDRPSSPGGGDLSFRGKWSAAAVEYEENDVVIIFDLEDTGISTKELAIAAGTFICLESHTSHTDRKPPQGATFENQWWATLARSRFEHLWSWDNRSAARQAWGTFHATGGNLTIDFGSRTADAYGNTTKLILNTDVFGDGSEEDPCQANLCGVTFRPILVDICVEGGLQQMWVLGTAPAEIT